MLLTRGVLLVVFIIQKMTANKSTNKGFTLIEVIIYIALFSLLIGTALITAHQLIQDAGNINSKNNTQMEGSFVLSKLNWALTSASTFHISSGVLHIDRYDSNQIDIQLAGGKINMTESLGFAGNITTGNVSVSNLTFTTISGTPKGITVTATIDGKDFTITKYIRQ